jgi:uncharacterized protein YebE (UPF0316 family)
MLEAIALAFVIMGLRTIDVSLGTLKTIFIVEGRSVLAPSLGFIEATVYVIAASIVFTDLGNPIKILGFGIGFGIGTASGMYMARRLGLGSVTVRLFKSGDAEALIGSLRDAGFRLTTMSGEGRDGPVSMIQMILRKRAVPRALDAAKPWLSTCFVTVGDEPLPDSSPPAIMDVVRSFSQMPWAVLFRKPHA